MSGVFRPHNFALHVCRQAVGLHRTFCGCTTSGTRTSTPPSRTCTRQGRRGMLFLNRRFACSCFGPSCAARAHTNLVYSNHTLSCWTSRFCHWQLAYPAQNALDGVCVTQSRSYYCFAACGLSGRAMCWFWHVMWPVMRSFAGSLAFRVSDDVRIVLPVQGCGECLSIRLAAPTASPISSPPVIAPR